jgi:type I restriction enzyme S subunit
MQQLLTGKTRLPGFEGEWIKRQIKDITEIPVTDGPHLTPKFLPEGVPFLSVNNLSSNRVDTTDLRYISLTDHQVFSKKCKPKKWDILLGKAASVGKVAIVDFDWEFNIWSPIALIRIRYPNIPRFIYYSMQAPEVVKQIEYFTNSSSQGNIGMGDIEKLELNLPTPEEQTAIATILSDMDAGIAALEHRREKAVQIKQGMMQQLLTGRIRLPSAGGVSAQ